MFSLWTIFHSIVRCLVDALILSLSFSFLWGIIQWILLSLLVLFGFDLLPFYEGLITLKGFLEFSKWIAVLFRELTLLFILQASLFQLSPLTRIHILNYPRLLLLTQPQMAHHQLVHINFRTWYRILLFFINKVIFFNPSMKQLLREITGEMGSSSKIRLTSLKRPHLHSDGII